jgi:DNA-binding transcriptional MocR family regulator
LTSIGASQTAYDLLFTMVELQEDGGVVKASQRELAARIGASRNALQRAMGLLIERGLVLEPQRYRTYEMHPFISDQHDEQALNRMLREALARIESGEIPDIDPPEYDVQPPRKATSKPGLRRVS